jgi:hypothetical protein
MLPDGLLRRVGHFAEEDLDLCGRRQRQNFVRRGCRLATRRNREASQGEGLPAHIGIETGPTSTWLITELRALGLPIICNIDARHAKAVLTAQINKSDRNDETGIARIMQTGERPCRDAGDGEIFRCFANAYGRQRPFDIDPPTSSQPIMRRGTQPYRGENHGPARIVAESLTLRHP